MYLYESEYGYTQLRLYVYIILVFMSVFMILIALNLWMPSFKVIEVATMIGLVYFLIVGSVNVDTIIVKQNVQRYESVKMMNSESDGLLDMRYLISLSDDAMPELIEFVDSHPDYQWRDSDLIAYENRLAKLVNNHSERSIIEFNLRHQKAYGAITNNH